MTLPIKDFFPVIYALKLVVNENDKSIFKLLSQPSQKIKFRFLIFVFVVTFFCRFSLVSSIYQSLLLMTKVQAHFGIQQLGCAPATTMDSA